MTSIDLDLLNREILELHREVLETVSSPSTYRKLLEEAITYVDKPPLNSSYATPRVIQVQGGVEYAFIGDIHGDYYTLLKILDTMWSIRDNTVLVFLGDYIDRGYMQLETLAFLLKLKEKFNQRVVLLRGNHEPPLWLIPHPHDYPVVLKRKYGLEASSLYEYTIEIFDKLPLTVVREGVFLALHGGPPLKVLNTGSWREAFTCSTNEECSRLLEEVLWSDPTEHTDYYTISPRGAGILYGRIVSSKTIQLIQGGIVIRGHEAVNGVRLSHNGLVVTVFSSPLVYELQCAGLLVVRPGEPGKPVVEKHCISPPL